MPQRLRINEIYRSIQGESSWAGLPCTFVRLTGCHLRCTYCDSAHAFYDGTWMTLDDIVQQVAALGTPLVEITGGEPLLQPDCGRLCTLLLERGCTVLCETSGALPIDRLPVGVIRIMDLKCPSSGEAQRNDWSNIDRLGPRDEVKFVVGSREDYDWSTAVIRAHDLTRRCTVLMSAVFGCLEPRLLVDWILQDRLAVRFQLQLHKIVWEPSAVGV